MKGELIGLDGHDVELATVRSNERRDDFPTNPYELINCRRHLDSLQAAYHARPLRVK
jgi:hypothetical protein